MVEILSQRTNVRKLHKVLYIKFKKTILKNGVVGNLITFILNIQLDMLLERVGLLYVPITAALICWSLFF